MEIEKRTLIKIDAEIKKHVKSQAAYDEITLAEAVEQALDDWLLKRKGNTNG